MTLNKLTRIMKSEGCSVDRYTCTHAGETKSTTYIDYENKKGHIEVSVEKIQGNKPVVVLVHRLYAEELANKYGILEGMVLEG